MGWPETVNLKNSLAKKNVLANTIVMIDINGKIQDASHFNWLNDSGFRYGYGCFETMRLNHARVPLLNYHINRIQQSLMAHHIPDVTANLKTRIDALAQHTHTRDAVCRLYVTGGPISPQPKPSPSPVSILALSPHPTTTATPICDFTPIESTPQFQHKSMAYSHHLIAMSSSQHWPIYTNPDHTIVDSAIFAVGCIQDNTVLFPAHHHQLPSVSRQALLDHWPTAKHTPMSQTDFESADSHFACNAIRGVFPIQLNARVKPPHPLIQKLNDCLNGVSQSETMPPLNDPPS